jgi:hypothetical protein
MTFDRRNITSEKKVGITVGIVVGLMGYYAFFLLAWLTETVRFDDPRLHYLTVGVALLIPSICILILLIFTKSKIRIWGVIILSPIALVSSLLFLGWLFLVTLWIPDVLLHDVDYSFERLRTVTVGDRHLTVYRTNGGATTSFGIVVREEKSITPGISWVKRVYEAYPADDVLIELKKDGSLQFTPY